MTTTQQDEQPLVYTTGRHWPVLLTSPYDNEPDEVETVQAPTYADAVRSAGYLHQAPYTAHVIPIPASEHISAGPDPEEVIIPAVVQLSQALLAAHAPEYAVTSTEDRHEDRLAVMRIAAEAMRDSAAAIAEQPGEWSRLESLADRIRALPLPADNKDKAPEPCRSFTVLDAIETYCEHSSGDGHGGNHYAAVNGCTRTWTDAEPTRLVVEEDLLVRAMRAILYVTSDDEVEKLWSAMVATGARNIPTLYGPVPSTGPERAESNRRCAEQGRTSGVAVGRSCTGCGRQLRDASPGEIDAAANGRPLPDVTGECPTCTPHTAARPALPEATDG